MKLDEKCSAKGHRISFKSKPRAHRGLIFLILGRCRFFTLHFVRFPYTCGPTGTHPGPTWDSPGSRQCLWGDVAPHAGRPTRDYLQYDNLCMVREERMRLQQADRRRMGLLGNSLNGLRCVARKNKFQTKQKKKKTLEIASKINKHALLASWRCGSIKLESGILSKDAIPATLMLKVSVSSALECVDADC